MKKIVSILLVLVLFISTESVYVSADTIYGKKEIPLKIGSTVTGSLVSGNSDTYCIEPKEIGLLKITIKSNIMDVICANLSSATNKSNVVTKGVDFSKENSGITYSVYVAPGVYYLSFTNNTSSLPGEFEITTKFTAIATSDIAQNNDKNTAMQIYDNKFYRGMLAFDQLEDYYTIQVKNDKLKLNIICEDKESLQVALINKKGEPVTPNKIVYYKTNPYQFDEKIPKGTYYLIVSQNGKIGDKGRKYVITTGNYILVTSVKLPSKKSMKVGDTYQIKPAAVPKKNSEVYTFSSTNKKVVTVTKTGKVKAIGKGTAKVTLVAKDSKISASCKISVSEAAVTKVSIKAPKTSILIGESIKLTAKVFPEKSVIKKITWKSSDSEVATVSSSGKVIGKVNGTVKITAKAGSKSDFVIIKIKAKPVPTAKPEPKAASTPTPAPEPKKIEVTGISLSDASLSLNKGDTYVLKATITPENATNKALKWSSTDSTVVTVSKGKLKCLKQGSARIIVTTANGEKDLCTVYVN